jgi:CheY-like chemotaxis protein
MFQLLPFSQLDQERALSKQILVIDDEEVIRLVVRSCFEDLAGWQVTTVSSGRDGLQRIQESLPDAIVLDVMMPEMDGLTFLTLLRQTTNGATVPVVLLTARSELTNAVTCAKLGVMGAIAKPFDPIHLINQMTQLLGWADISHS